LHDTGRRARHLPREPQLQLSLALAVLLAAADGGVGSLEGTWLLAPARSGALDPLLDRVGAGFFAKTGARTSRPTHVISLAPGTATTVALDGKTPVKDDFGGHPVQVTSVLEGGVLTSRGHLSLGDQQVPIELRRWVHADGTMRFVIKLAPAGEPALEVERVFTRQ
jgi:hypothetical protein